MKIAVLSDIHGNAEALIAVLQEASKIGVAEYFVLGDYVGYYYKPATVVRLIRKLNAILLKGNHEDILSGLIRNELNKDQIKSKYGSGHEIAINTLEKEELEFLFCLPCQRLIHRNGTSILLSHGAPFDNESYLYPDSSSEVFDKCNRPDVQIAFFGHSHYQFMRTCKNTLLVNPGSVGQSREIGGFAKWCIFDSESKTIVMKSTPYNLESIFSDIDIHDPELTYLKSVLLR